jgi:hypothetical protein
MEAVAAWCRAASSYCSAGFVSGLDHVGAVRKNFASFSIRRSKQVFLEGGETPVSF